MCDPVSIGYAVVAVAGLVTARRSAKAQERALKEQQKVKDEEIAQQTGAEMDQRQRDAAAERGRLRALSAETGLTGISLTDIQNNVDFGLGMDLATLKQNGASATRQNRAETNSRLSGIEQPDYVGTLVGAGLQIQQNRASMPSKGP